MSALVAAVVVWHAAALVGDVWAPASLRLRFNLPVPLPPPPLPSFPRPAYVQRTLYEDYMASSEARATLSSGNFLGIINVLMSLRKVRRSGLHCGGESRSDLAFTQQHAAGRKPVAVSFYIP